MSAAEQGTPSADPSILRTVFFLVACIAAVCLALPLTFLGVLLGLNCLTLQGWLCAASAALGGLAILLLCMSLGKRTLLRWSLGTGSIALGALVWIGIAAPGGHPPADAAFQSVYLEGASPARYSIPNLVPEIDQFMLAGRILPSLDPYIDKAKGKRLRELFRKVYLPMREDSAFREAGSVMTPVYSGIFGGEEHLAHHYQYIPPHVGDEPLPVVLFLHGSLGNFKGYIWQWKSFADQHGVAIIAPSGGLGNWQQDETERVVQRCLSAIEQHPQLDANRLLLAGLSNGGKGVSRTLVRWPDRWKAIVFISSVLIPELAPQMARTVPSSCPVIIIHGEHDLRVPTRYIEDTALPILREGQFEIRLHVIRDEDHYLIFSQPDEVFKRLPPRW